MSCFKNVLSSANISEPCIRIIEQPQDQIIHVRNNTELCVKLTCYAESLESNYLHYEWYCVDSSTPINYNSCAEIPLKKLSENTTKQYYCKVSIPNQPEHYVNSRTAVIKLEISKFYEHIATTIYTVSLSHDIIHFSHIVLLLKLKLLTLQSQ